MKSSECEGWTRMNRQIRKMLDEQSRWLRIYQFLEENPPPSDDWRNSLIRLLTKDNERDEK